MYHERNLRDDRYKRQILVYKDHKEEGRDAHTLPCGSEEGLLCEETYGPVFEDAIVFPEKGPGSTATVQFKRHAELQQASGISHADVLSTFHLLISMDSQVKRFGAAIANHFFMHSVATYGKTVLADSMFSKELRIKLYSVVKKDTNIPRRGMEDYLYPKAGSPGSGIPVANEAIVQSQEKKVDTKTSNGILQNATAMPVPYCPPPPPHHHGKKTPLPPTQLAGTTQGLPRPLDESSGIPRVKSGRLDQALEDNVNSHSF
ncbi:hypothetical protein MJG53_009345 [Ovis ammon polii x Ovis aries]|uniref:Uncharacterized protein n=1 Tax=Ovis ammon polii x Ovis aries TaxID=2918886 RepID=A0ACB9UXA4_9CETA|nr:hypothetical protein MJG53_009345 [Ovis ammon polii x Ovis aries]